MGCGVSKPMQPPASAESTCCILGVAGSGKSTYVKQLRCLHNQSWTPSELDDITTSVQVYLLQRMKEVLDHCKILSLELDGVNHKHSRVVYFQIWDDRSPRVLGELWKDVAVIKGLEALSGEARFQMFPYFMRRLDALGQPNYRPTTEDILRTRMRTSTVSLTSVFADKSLWRFIDCGGQKNERSKWPNILKSEPLSLILFCVAVNEYDIPSTETPTKTNLEISFDALITLFQDNESQVPKVPVIFLLNKLDAFIPKFNEDPLSFKKAFPEFGGKKYQEALEYVELLITKRMPNGSILHFIQLSALDLDLSRAAFDGIKESSPRE